MKKVFLTTVLLTALIGIFFAEEIAIRGVVRDINNQPLKEVKIVLQENGKKKTFSSGENGEFVIPVSVFSTEIQLTFESPQFNTETKTLFTDEMESYLEVVLIPLNLLKNEITITALNEEEPSVSVPFAQNVVSTFKIREKQPENILNSLLATPGVFFIGKGGFTATPSIRGLARRRILILADGARITSDRSVGTSAAFISPEMVRQIEVLRSSASVLYGSDAIGGVINILAENDLGPDVRYGIVNLGGSSNDKRRSAGFRCEKNWEHFSFYSNLQFTKADDYLSPEGRIFNSGFTYYSGHWVLTRHSPERDFSVSYLKSYGKNIQRPRRDNDPNIKSCYPVEDNNLVQVNYCEKSLLDDGVISFSAYVNPNRRELDKLDFQSGKYEYSKNSSLDFGIKGVLKKTVSPTFSYQAGLDYFGRHDVDMENNVVLDGVPALPSMPVANGSRNDYGLFFTLDYAGLKSFDFLGGVRYGFFSRNALSDQVFKEKKSHAPAAFFGVTRHITRYMNVFLNMGTAFRMPSLSESFYTGITGRGYVISNSELEPERSINVDVGLKFYTQRIFFGCYLFHYTIEDMIEKYRITNETYTYDNLNKGRINGFELEFQFFPQKNLELFGNYFTYNGKSVISNQPLNDVPSAKLYLGGRVYLGRFWTEVNHVYSSSLNWPGPAEIPVRAYNVTNVKGGYYLSSKLFLFLKVSNLFDSFYYANADPDIPPATGFDLSIGLTSQF